MSDLVYLRISPGYTGSSAQFEDSICDRVQTVMKRIRSRNPNLIVAGGIGIRGPEQVAALAALGLDMAIVGTTLVEQMALGEDHLRQKIADLGAATAIPIS